MRGRKPRRSTDPREQRMVPIRMTGALHKSMVEVAKKTNTSLNRFVTEAIREKIEREQDASD